MKKSLSLFVSLIALLCGCNPENRWKSSQGILQNVSANGTQIVGIGRPGYVTATGHIKITIVLKNDDYIGKSMTHKIVFDNSILYLGDKVLNTSYSFDFDCSYTYYTGVNQSQKQTLTILNDTDIVGYYEYTAEVEWKTSNPGEDL